MKQLQRSTRATVRYYPHPPQLYAQERVIPAREWEARRRREMHPVKLVALIIGPLLLVGLGAIMFWLGYR